MFYRASDQTINVTSFQVGSSTLGLEFTFSTTYSKINSLSAVWGEFLNTNQLLASWVDGDVLKHALVDVSKGTVPIPTIVSMSINLLEKSRIVPNSTKKSYGLC